MPYTHLAFSNAWAPSESCRRVKAHRLDAAQVLTYYVLMCSQLQQACYLPAVVMMRMMKKVSQTLRRKHPRLSQSCPSQRWRQPNRELSICLSHAHTPKPPMSQLRTST